MIINHKVTASTLLAACLLSLDAAALDDLDLSESMISEWEESAGQGLLVLTPTRIGQSIHDTPGTVTVLTRRELLNRGITSVPEALRLVPGMSVNKSTGFSQESGHDYQISYHGGSARLPRRLQVQVDGMSVYLGGLSKIDWTQLPVTVHDIERIEVTRNPSAATYGANSFSAVVNVITRHPNDVATHEAFVEAGTRDDAFALYRLSGHLGENAVSFRASSTRDAGYDYGNSTIEGADMFEGHRDSMAVDRLSLRLDRQIGDKTQFSASAGAVSGDYEVEYVVANQEPSFAPDVEIDDWFVNFAVSRAHSRTAETRLRAYTKSSQLEQDFRACAPLAYILPESFQLARENESYFNSIVAGQVPSGGSAEDDALAVSLLMRLNELGPQALSPVCGTLNQNYVDRRHHLTVEHHRVVGDSLRVVGGATVERLENDSETFFDGKVSQNLFGVFFNSEWKRSASFTYNAGFYLESSDSVDDTSFNPRVSINWHTNPDMTWRIVANRAYRSPDLAETERAWSYTVRDVRPVIDIIDHGIFADYASSEGFELEAERIDAIELGVFVESLRLPYTLDVRVFHEELDNLISEKPGFSTFDLTNNSEGTVSGAEAAVKYEITERLSFDFSYSYQNHDFESDLESGLNADHQGQAALAYTSTDRVITASYIGNSIVSHRSFDQWSLTWLEKFMLGKTYLDLRAHLEYMPSEVGYAEDDIGLLNVHGYVEEIFGKVSLELSF